MLTIDIFIVLLSVLVGWPLGFICGVYTAQWACDQYAKQFFDSLLVLRKQAKEQVDQHEALTKGSRWNVKR